MLWQTCTEHDDTGRDSKRLHSESVDAPNLHGDVVPQTPQSEAGHDVIDDTPFESMMLGLLPKGGYKPYS